MARGRIWSVAELNTIREMAPHGALAIADALRRTESAVASKASYLGVRLGRCDSRYDIANPATFLDRVEYDTNGGCWLWPTSIDQFGYADAFPRGQGRTKAHRLSWRLFRGEIPGGLLVLHRCDVRNCVNPDHLFLGTDQDNTDDKFNKGRARNSAGPVTRGRKPKPRRERKRRTHCKRGHPFEGVLDSQGFQRCRICTRDHMRARRAAWREDHPSHA